ncbi:MAG: PPOX class F420-dependent oxidoreductase [Anaerolineae bacterium]|nr:PPOX class F420-dependent oxidoreductase [Anaerolineae bacterium]
MPVMTQPEIEAFLHAPHHAIVGTNRRDGAPHLSPVWYLYEEGRLYIIIAANTAKYRNLQRDPRICVCIDGGHPDYRTVTLYGTAMLQADTPKVTEIRWRIIRRYYENEADARRYADSTRDQPHVLVTIIPEKIISQDFNS